MIRLEFETIEELQDFLRSSQPTLREMDDIVKHSHRERDILQNRLDIAQNQAQAAMTCDDAELFDMIANMEAKLDERIEYLEIQMIQLIDPTGCNVCTDAGCDCEPETCELPHIDLTPIEQEVEKCKAEILKNAAEYGYFADVDDIVVLKHETNRHSYYLVLLAGAWAAPKRLRCEDAESTVEFRVEFPGTPIGTALVSSALSSCTISTSINRISVRTGIKSQMDNLVYLVVSHYKQDGSGCIIASKSGIDNINESMFIMANKVVA